MTRVLHIISGLGVGGAEATLVALTRELKAMGFEQTVVGLADGPNAAVLRANGIPTEVLHASAARLVPAGLKLASLAMRFRPDVVQGWLYLGDLAALATRPFLRRGARVAWNIRASDMDLDRYGRVLGVCARLSGLPDVVLANSRVGAEAHRARGYRPKGFLVIPNGIDVARFRPNGVARAARRAEWGISPDAIVAAHVARLDAQKDHATLLPAIAATPEVFFVLAGAGTEVLDLPANARALGRIPDPESLYAAADIAVSSSAFGEGFPNVLAEGMAAGCVAISTDCGDARDIVGDLGAVVPIGDSRALASAFATEARRGPEERAARALLARERIVSTFGLERMVQAYARLYWG